MCTPMICVSPVGIHKTLKLQGKHGSYEGQILWVYILKFQLTQNINGRRSEWNYWFETVFGKCLARRQRLQARDTNITTITVQWCVYPNISQNVCLPLRLWVLIWNILLIQNCTRLDRPRVHWHITMYNHRSVIWFIRPYQGIHISQNSDRSRISVVY